MHVYLYDVQFKDILKKKTKILIFMSLAIIGDVIPVIFIMAGIWIVKSFSNVFGFEEFVPIKLLMAASEVFMLTLYLILVGMSLIHIYKLYKDGEL